jgi:hypothetical protein
MAAGLEFDPFNREEKVMSTMFAPNRGVMRWRKAPFRGWIVTSIIIFGALEFSACSTGQPPTATLSKAEMDLRAASEARAGEFAPMDLQTARDKLDQSKQAMAAKKYEEARRLAEVAQVEAELAEAKAEAEIARQAAEDLQKRIDSHRADIGRGPGQKSSAGAAPGVDHESK